ncbi:MAG TPA: lipoyl(octanoyl) transferase LipB [Actinomycetota bacterium]|nr:lipoyl(octanoyl) transferase LipB [Actinomycetota bacterium]
MEPLWLVRAGTVPYRRAWAWQRALVERRAAGEIPDTALLLEHPHVYTIGKRGSGADVLASPEWLAAQGAEVVRSDRGGQVTYHGPGQLVGYPVTRLDPEPDVWRFVRRVEDAMVAVAADFGLEARGESGLLTGVWVEDAKLVAIGMRVSRGVTSHGFALNCATDLAKFAAIVPCGMPDRAACSLSSALGRTVTVADALPVVERRLAEALDRAPVEVDAATLDLPATDHPPEPDFAPHPLRLASSASGLPAPETTNA